MQGFPFYGLDDYIPAESLKDSLIYQPIKYTNSSKFVNIIELMYGQNEIELLDDPFNFFQAAKKHIFVNVMSMREIVD